MSTQYQSKPVLTDALTGKLKNGESPHGYQKSPHGYQKSQSDINSDETVILVKDKTTKYGYQLLDVNNSVGNELPQPDMCLSFTFCMCVLVIFGTATYGAFLMFEKIAQEKDNTGNSTIANITNITDFA